MGEPLDCDHFIDLIEEELKGTFAAMLKRAQQQRAARAGRRPCLSEELATEVLVSEKRYRAATDLACRHWASTRKWPMVEPQVADCIVDRLTTALSILCDLQDLQATISANEEQVLSWVLVDWWKFYGRAQWIIGGFPLDWIPANWSPGQAMLEEEAKGESGQT